jgi:uncharacterized protein
MTEVEIRKPTETEIIECQNWSIWEKEVSEFPWEYNTTERCYILDGKADIITDNKTYSFKKGDFVIFHEGLKCRWKIKERIKKHYKFD